jgi:hypothetical protein
VTALEVPLRITPEEGPTGKRHQRVRRSGTVWFAAMARGAAG